MLYLLITLLVLTIICLVFYYVKDRRYVKHKTVESIGDDLWNEIDHERQESVEKGKLFRKILEKAKKKSPL